jgi:hypothetical protein
VLPNLRTDQDIDDWRGIAQGQPIVGVLDGGHSDGCNSVPEVYCLDAMATDANAEHPFL